MIFPQEQDHPFSHQKHQYYYTSQTKQVEFFQHWNQQATSYPSPQCLTDQIKVHSAILHEKEGLHHHKV